MSSPSASKTIRTGSSDCPASRGTFIEGTGASGARIGNRIDSQLGVAARCQGLAQLLRGIRTLTTGFIDRSLGDRHVDHLPPHNLAPFECIHCGTSTSDPVSAWLTEKAPPDDSPAGLSTSN